ncbi:MAG: ATP-dependent zinc metalloprotease FtsH, partial [Flavobacteriales bacterium]
ILDDICSALGGRAAEELIFGKISTGALSDLEKVTKQAYAMVSIYGLNDRIGNISYYDPNGNQFTKPYSDETAKIIDEEVSKLIEKEYDRALQLLKLNKEKLENLAEKLLEKEVIFKEDLVDVFGKRKWDKEEIIEDKKAEETSEEAKNSDIEKENPATEDSEESTSNEKNILENEAIQENKAKVDESSNEDIT